MRFMGVALVDAGMSRRGQAVFWSCLILPHVVLLLTVHPYVDGVVPDAVGYLSRGQAFATGGDLRPLFNLLYGGMVVVILAAFFWLFSEAAVWAYVLLQHSLTVLAAYLIFTIAYQIFRCRAVAISAAVFFSLSGMTLAFAHTVLAGFWIMFFLIVCVYFLSRARASSTRRRSLLLVSGLFFALSCLSKITGAALFLVVPPIFLLQYGLSTASIRNAAIFLCPYLLTFVPIVSVNFTCCGTLWGGVDDAHKNHLDTFFGTTVHFVDPEDGPYRDVRHLIHTDALRCESENSMYCVGLTTTHLHLARKVYRLLAEQYGIVDPVVQNQILNSIAIGAVLHNPVGYLLRRGWETVRFSLSWYSYITVVNLTEEIQPRFSDLWRDRKFGYLLIRTALYYLNPVCYMQVVWLLVFVSLVNLRGAPHVDPRAYLALCVPVLYFTGVAVFIRWGVDRLRFPAEPYIYMLASHGLMVVYGRVSDLFRRRFTRDNPRLWAVAAMGVVYIAVYPLRRVITLLLGLDLY